MIQAGILSDTHLSVITEQFRNIASHAFADCNIIIHAGDITNIAILYLFDGKTVHAVHGNMCSHATRQQLPEKKIIMIDAVKIGLCHGAGPRHSIEERMWNLFPEADCIIFGHTHQAICETRGKTLFINPGSFQCDSAFSTPASYAILKIDGTKLSANLHTISLTP